MKVLIETQYIPNIAWFKLLNQSDEFCIESYENFQKQSYRNRTLILTANKVDSLTVPVVKGNSKQLIKDVKIDYSQNWQQVHLRTIRAAYGNSPFFEHYFPYVEQIVSKKNIFLFDLNHQFIARLVKLLKINKEISFTEDYIDGNDCQYVDFRGVIHPKKSLKMNPFLAEFSFSTYTQVFGENFVENLSIIDLLMNEGSAAKQYL